MYTKMTKLIDFGLGKFIHEYICVCMYVCMCVCVCVCVCVHMFSCECLCMCLSCTDAFLSHKVDQMVLINYDGQRREKRWA